MINIKRKDVGGKDKRKKKYTAQRRLIEKKNYTYLRKEMKIGGFREQQETVVSLLKEQITEVIIVILIVG